MAVRALDTNILVRFFTADDAAQAERVRRLFAAAEARSYRFLVLIPVLLDLVWVLSRGYGYGREDLCRMLESMLIMPVIEMERPDIVQAAVNLARDTGGDLADAVIGLLAEGQGCDSVLTFDRKAASRLPIYESAG
jgi:predicted nucleic-acid-binding protein